MVKSEIQKFFFVTVLPTVDLGAIECKILSSKWLSLILGLVAWLKFTLAPLNPVHYLYSLPNLKKIILNISECYWFFLNIIVVFLQTSTRNFARSPPAKRAIHSRLSAASNTAASNDGKRASNQASNKVRVNSRIEF